MRKRMRERTYEEEPQYNWIVYAVVMLLVGGLAGYILSESTSTSAAPGVATSSAPIGAPPGVVLDEGALRAYQDILARDPQNVQAAVGAGNLLYDAKRYSEAIPYYERALAIRSDVNVSTDLGTALWYSGHADLALAQYARSLAIEPVHAQTLFNIGIVKSEGKRDYRGAIEAWRTLLEKNPTYPGASNVRSMIAEAEQKTVSTSGL